ncbi:hypothetical protein B0H66DRAFT_637894 [Apodospora peruviana]|uniref:Uncharacterized protein n=1 Tax=Apodospora peruviana TaxID=516989 RepID=A0AAE0IK55_9PEZI|nr:hypothetical protein B0H66DRAFT_637894 [Apodospora peruviana]
MGGVPDGVTLRKLLIRRYFSGAWVIQELLRSWYAVIPVGDTQFWASNLTVKFMDFDWDSTAAPWLQYLGDCSCDQNDLFPALHRTWLCEASDPRDRIFGILGLLRSEGQDILVSDYRISTRHIFIGVFAHILINHGVASVLMSASGLAAFPGCPSWVLDWQSSRPLESNPSLDDTEELRKKRLRRAQGAAEPARMHAWSRRNLCSANTTLVFVFPLSLQSSIETPPAKIHWYVCKVDRERWYTYLESRSSIPEQYDPGRSRRYNAWVDSATGALTTKLIHIFKFEASPASTKVAGLYEVIPEPCALYIMTEEGGPQLDAVIPPGPNHLFCLEKERGEADYPEYLLVFMREILDPEHEAVKSFKLILCCPCDDMFLLCPDVQREWTRFSPGCHQVNRLQNLHCVIPASRQMIFPKRMEGRMKGFDQADALGAMFPGPQNQIVLYGFLPLFQNLLNESRGQAPGFAATYTRCLKMTLPQIGVKVDDNGTGPCIELMLTPEDVAKYWTSTGSAWRPCDTHKPSERVSVTVRASIRRLMDLMYDTHFYCAVGYLSFATAAARARGKVPDAYELMMLTRDPRPEDYLVPYRPWPPSVVDSFAADGVPWEVRIV